MARDILLNELIDIMEEMAKQGGETNISLRDILVKAIDNRVTKFKSNGGKIDYNSLEDMAYQFMSDLFEMSVEEVKAMSEKRDFEIIDNMKRIY